MVEIEGAIATKHSPSNAVEWVHFWPEVNVCCSPIKKVYPSPLLNLEQAIGRLKRSFHPSMPPKHRLLVVEAKVAVLHQALEAVEEAYHLGPAALEGLELLPF